MQLFKVAFNSFQIIRIMSFYAVANGRKIGIYNTWRKCEEQVKGFKEARYKKFPTHSEAEAFIAEYNASKKTQYKPQDIAVPLGRNKNTDLIAVKKEIPEFWPPSDGDSFDDNQLTDEDLLMALAEVEGLPDNLVQERKRKTDFSSASGSSSYKYPKYDSKIWEPAGIKHIGSLEFLIDEDGFVIVYTDGSCINNGQKNACAGYGVYFGDDHPLNVGNPVTGRVTNNVGEIQAAIYAVKTAKRLGISKLCLSTDSQFLINAINIWVKGWKAKNWRLRDGKPVKNEVDFKELDGLLQDGTIDIKWNYVKGHCNIKGNEMADKLAREGSEKHRSLYTK